MDENATHHIITLDNRNRLTVTAVNDIESFDEEKIVILTEMGSMTVSGADFKINRLNVDDGQLIIDGEVDEIHYSQTPSADSDRGFFGKLFR